MKLRSTAITILSIIAINSWAVPSIAVPEIIISNKQINNFISNDQSIIPDNETIQKLKQQLGQISLMVHQQITNSLPLTTKNIDSVTLNSINFNDDHSEVSIESEPTLIHQISRTVKTLNPLPNKSPIESEPKFDYPDYVLIGHLHAITAGNVIQQIDNSDTYSNIYNLDLAVHYKLIKTSDQSIILNFIASGQAGEASLQSNAAPKIPTDINNLINQVDTQLSTEAVSRIQEKFPSLIAAESVESSINTHS